MLVDDPHTSAILLFMETIRDAGHLARAGRAAYEAGKPIIVYKLGRSEAGQDMAASHTGAMAGSDEMADAFFRAHGMLRVDMLETLFELPALLTNQKPRPRHRIAVMTTTGAAHGNRGRPPRHLRTGHRAATATVIANLAQKNIRISAARVTDLTLAGAKKESTAPVLNELLASDHCDLVLAVVGSSAQFQPEIAWVPLSKPTAATKRSPCSWLPTPRHRSSCWPTRAWRLSHPGSLRRRHPGLVRLDGAGGATRARNRKTGRRGGAAGRGRHCPAQ